MGRISHGFTAHIFATLLAVSDTANSSGPLFVRETHSDDVVLRLVSGDGTNRLTRARVLALTKEIASLALQPPHKLVITGHERFFSAGADLNEIAALDRADVMAFARMGQALMSAVANFPGLTIAAVEGYCMGGGLDLALACSRRIASPHAVFGHRGAALGMITGWGGTQRLPRLIGRARALQMLVAAEKVHAQRALDIGLVDRVADDPVEAAVAWNRKM